MARNGPERGLAARQDGAATTGTGTTRARVARVWHGDFSLAQTARTSSRNYLCTSGQKDERATGIEPA